MPKYVYIYSQVSQDIDWLPVQWERGEETTTWLKMSEKDLIEKWFPLQVQHIGSAKNPNKAEKANLSQKIKIVREERGFLKIPYQSHPSKLISVCINRNAFHLQPKTDMIAIYIANPWCNVAMHCIFDLPLHL